MNSNREDATYMDRSNELDLTNQHDLIISGIQKVKKLYKLTYAQARSIVESAYIERIEKIPQFITIYQDLLANSRNFLLYLEKSNTKTKLTFNLLKCNHTEGVGSLQIEGFKEQVLLAFASPVITVTENKISEFTCRVLAEKDKEIGKFPGKLYEKISKMPVEQIVFCQSITIFENFKNELVDCCFFMNLELSGKDRAEILRVKFRDLQTLIERLRTEGQGNFRKEFKPTCCDCFLF